MSIRLGKQVAPTTSMRSTETTCGTNLILAEIMKRTYRPTIRRVICVSVDPCLVGIQMIPHTPPTPRGSVPSVLSHQAGRATGMEAISSG